MTRARIYLDHNASAPLRAEALDAMLRVLRDVPGNPSSVHAEGERAREVLAQARERVAALLGAQPDEIVFTSGATEANNAVFASLASGSAPAAIATSAVEHPSVEQPLGRLEKRGWRVARHPVTCEGELDAREFLASLCADVQLVSLIAANNETGVLFPIAAIADGLRERGIALHLDATQWIGKLPLDARKLPVDSLACSAHKLGGPKGVGCLFVRRGVAFEPALLGGSQERRRRAGTENLAGIAGFGAACEAAQQSLAAESQRVAALRDRLWRGLRERVPGVLRNGGAQNVLPNTLNAAFPAARGELLLQALDLDGVAVSAGAACASGSLAPSPVLLAMGLGAERAAESLRFSLGPATTADEIERVLALVPPIVARVRASGATR